MAQNPLRRERLLLAAVLALMLGATALHFLSDVDLALSRRRSVTGAVSADRIYYWRYEPSRRTLNIVVLPLSAAPEESGRERSVSRLLAGRGAPPLDFWLRLKSGAPRSPEEADPSGLVLPLRLTASPAAGGRPAFPAPPFWRTSGLMLESSLPVFERFLLWSELRKIPLENTWVAQWPMTRKGSAWTTADKEAADLLAGLAASPARQSSARPVTVEVLNATQEGRLAEKATRRLRERGFDVVNVGNASMRSEKTCILDRTGVFLSAQRVYRSLGWPQAQAWTQMNLERLVDVTVILGADFTAWQDKGAAR